MSDAQLLLRRLLEEAGGAAETGFVLVLEGEGLADLPAQIPTARGPYAVHRVATELGLRHLLWRAQGAPLIAVLPQELASRIQRAPDLLRRAQNQQIHALSVNDVLQVLLGVRVVGADAQHLQRLALEHVDRIGREMTRRTLPTVVDRKLLTELLVDLIVGEPVRSRTAAELLAAWVKEPPRWSDDVSRLVREALPPLHAEEGRLLAWALEQPEERLRALVVHGAVLTVDAEELPRQAWGPLWAAAQRGALELDRRILRRVAARLAEGALQALGDEATSLLADADRLGRSTLTPSQLQTSRVLPLAFQDRCHALAQGAATGQAIRAADIAWLKAHRAAPWGRAELAVLEPLARLSRYLEATLAPVPPADIGARVRDYQRSGAFADVAVLQLRRALAASAHHHDAARQVLAAVRARRDHDNRQFAEALAGAYEGALHWHEVTPLHRLWKRVVAPVWEAQPDTRLYLAVLDGCSYPVFLELLFALSQDAAFPLGIRPDGAGAVAGIPALAPLPTVTSHARGAVFLGELPRDPLVAETVFRDQEEAKTDKARFKQNLALGGRSRALFLKGDLTDGGQGLLAAVGGHAVDVVAAVFNAVDDQIGSSNTGAVVRLSPEDIVAFKPSLLAAVRAGRRVLVVADHGHSPFVDNSLRAGAGPTPRFLPLAAGQAPPEGFLEIDLAGLGGPPERRAFAWRSGAYLGGQQVGFHGGCSLEEMVVPLAWIEPEGLQADEPPWWYGEGVVPQQPAPARPVPIAAVTPLPTAPPQLGLFSPEDHADELPISAELLGKLSREERAVLVLLRQNGSARISELAQKIGKNPGRLKGLMVNLRRTLHTGGVVLFRDEGLPDGETLYRYQPPEKGP